jgi:hypothetical protein
MKKIIGLFLIFLFILSCNDGDFDVPSFDFDEQTVQNCGDLVLFKINESEAIVFSINENNSNNTFFKQEMSNETFDLTNISYRIYSDEATTSLFCNDIPPTDPTVINEWIGTGNLIVNNTITNDDNDGIDETDLELDSDLDEIPDFYDFDDDNDGIKTIDELDADGVPLDTDGDNTLDYLDNDDDNDGIPTINELKTDSNGNNIVDYLDNETAILQDANPQLNNTYTLSYLTTFTIANLNLENDNGNTITFDTYDLGSKNGDIIISGN